MLKDVESGEGRDVELKVKVAGKAACDVCDVDTGCDVVMCRHV